MGQTLWTTDLHFDGSSLYDMTLCLAHLPDVHLDYIITYLSEVNFYLDYDTERFMYFFGVRDLARYLTLGAGRPGIDRYLVCGLLGDIFPVYRVWEPLSDRLKIWQTRNLDQALYDASLESDLAVRAQLHARTMSFGPNSAFQKRTFADFARMCRQRGAHLIVCRGQVNPILERAMNPAFRSDLTAFFREQAAADPNIILLDESQSPPQVESDYDDLTHVNNAARQRFSQYIANVLEKLAQAKAAPTSRT